MLHQPRGLRASALGAALLGLTGLAQPAYAGTFSITKTVIAPAGAQLPATIPLFLQCQGGPANAPYSVAPGGTLNIPGVIVANKGCRINEPALPPVANVPGCGGATAYWEPNPPTNYIGFPSDGQMHLDLVNRLVCGPGSLKVTKFVFNSVGATVPGTFPMAVICTLPANPLTYPISVPAGGSVQTPPIAAGSLCKVFEPPLPPIVQAPRCPSRRARWTTSYSTTTGVPIVSGQTAMISVANQLDCVPNP